MTKNFFLAALIIFMISVVSEANARDTFYPTLIEKMNNFYRIGRDLQADIMKSFFLFEKSLRIEPNCDELKSNSESFSKNIILFEKVSKDLNKYIQDHDNSFKELKSTIESIEKDTSIETLEKFKKYADSYQSFVDSIHQIEFTVYANEGWANSGLTVNENDILYIDAKGEWKVSSTYGAADWKGLTCISTTSYSLNKKAPLGALLFRVRGSSKSDGYTLNENKFGKIDSDGRLEFIINDSGRSNNSGQLNLKVVVFNGKALKEYLESIKILNNSQNF